LEKSPAKRYASAKQLFEALSSCRDSRGWSFETAHRWWQEQVKGEQTPVQRGPDDFNDHSIVG
ncbi:MAG: hypothetical protein SH850_18255, partial [Planctomycetaceae bacterium]|nr:hypothetical protein [Planctomycetaceae bacterium]